MNRWWDADPSEVYWVEITDRPVLGENLHAPQFKQGGTDSSGYSLVREAVPGDVVFHYRTPDKAIVGSSRVASPVQKKRIYWVAHGTSARKAKRKPRWLPGYWVELREYSGFAEPISRDEFQRRDKEVRRIRDDLETLYGTSLYFPFQRRRELWFSQSYLAKFPAALVRLIPQLERFAQVADRPDLETADDTGLIGAPYQPVDEDSGVAPTDPFTFDPAIRERGQRAHRATQNLLARVIAQHGSKPRESKRPEPDFDLAWSSQGRIFVAEVKSLTAANQERQLRLGLGQVLRYAQALAAVRKVKVVPVLAVEKEPADSSWANLCARVGVELVWPENLERLFAD
jgi:hypothetical protein